MCGSEKKNKVYHANVLPQGQAHNIQDVFLGLVFMFP